MSVLVLARALTLETYSSLFSKSVVTTLVQAAIILTWIVPLLYN